MSFSCKRCGYECEAKYLLKRHLQRKNPCRVLHQDLSPQQLLDELSDDPKKTLKCKYCKSTFTLSSNLYRHRKKCQKTNTLEIDLLKETVSNLQKQINSLQQSSTSTVHNTKIDNINNIFILNNFGNESYDHITNDFLKHCICNSLNGVKSLIEKIHFSDDAPMNKNVRLRSLKNNLVEVSDNQKWIVKDANEAMDTMINKGCKLLNGIYFNNEEDIMEYDINELDNRIQTFLLTVMDKNNKNYFAVRRRILALIIENTEDIIGN